MSVGAKGKARGTNSPCNKYSHYAIELCREANILENAGKCWKMLASYIRGESIERLALDQTELRRAAAFVVTNHRIYASRACKRSEQRGSKVFNRGKEAMGLGASRVTYTRRKLLHDLQRDLFSPLVLPRVASFPSTENTKVPRSSLTRRSTPGFSGSPFFSRGAFRNGETSLLRLVHPDV